MSGFRHTGRSTRRFEMSYVPMTTTWRLIWNLPCFDLTGCGGKQLATSIYSQKPIAFRCNSGELKLAVVVLSFEGQQACIRTWMPTNATNDKGYPIPHSVCLKLTTQILNTETQKWSESGTHLWKNGKSYRSPVEAFNDVEIKDIFPWALSAVCLRSIDRRSCL